MDADLEKWYKDQVKASVESIDKQWEAYKKVLNDSGGLPPIVSPDTIFPDLLRLMGLSKEMQGFWDAEHEERTKSWYR